MGIWDRFGRGTSTQQDAGASSTATDEQAIARYRYLLKTAPPETIEQAHAEAFAALTPEQRQKVLQRLSEEMPAAERAAAEAAGDSPGSLARAATRAEIRQPGAIERAFGGIGTRPASGGGLGFGSLLAGSMLGSVAGNVLGGMVAQHFFGSHPGASHLFDQDAHDAQSHAASSSADQDTRSDGDTIDSNAFDNDGDIAGDFGSNDSFDV